MRRITTVEGMIEARDTWARGLSEAVLRSLAYDYRQGNTLDQSCLDAEIELERRLYHGQLRGAVRCAAHLGDKGKASMSCPTCKQARREYAYSIDNQEALSPSAS